MWVHQAVEAYTWKRGGGVERIHQAGRRWVSHAHSLCTAMKVWVLEHLRVVERSDVRARAMYNAEHCEITAPLAVTHPTILGAV